MARPGACAIGILKTGFRGESAAGNGRTLGFAHQTGNHGARTCRQAILERVLPLNLAIVDPACRWHGAGIHTTEESIRLIETAETVELMAFSPDGDPLAMVAIAKPEALTLIGMPVTMAHAFPASHVGAGRVFGEAVRR